MRQDFNPIKKSHFLIYSFSLFFLQYSNIVKIIITINSNYFLYLKKFHILAQNKDRSIENEYNYNTIKNESQIKYPYKKILETI
jgi:hypothetical protein